MILVLLNTLAVLAALGTLFYTRVMFKRPPITESGERARLQEQKNKSLKPKEFAYVPFKQITINIAGNPAQPKEGGKDEAGKLHYITMAFALEVREQNSEGTIEEIKPVFLDQLIAKLGRKTFDELANVHGRFILRNEIMELANAILKDSLVTNVYFTHFIVQ